LNNFDTIATFSGPEDLPSMIYIKEKRRKEMRRRRGQIDR
jgi:hypothetical protein